MEKDYTDEHASGFQMAQEGFCIAQGMWGKNTLLLVGQEFTKGVMHFIPFRLRERVVMLISELCAQVRSGIFQIS